MSEPTEPTIILPTGNLDEPDPQQHRSDSSGSETNPDSVEEGEPDSDQPQTLTGLEGQGPAAEERAQEGEEQETWQNFLRRVTPQEIAQREQYDPVRRAYVQNRLREVSDEGRQRRRAVTSAGQYTESPASARESRRRPMSLQFQNRPLPRPPSSARELPALPGEYIVPRWQPDNEVWSCPICERDFNMFFRRHHCRKCGRVVCANCSPHRITIPRQFIVHPPVEGEESTPRLTRTDVVDLAFQDEDGDRSLTSALGGGEEVRLCNPCVPDPNPLPPPSYISPNGQHFTTYPHAESTSSSERRRYRVSMPPQPTHRYLSEQNVPVPGARSASHRWSSGPNSAVPRLEPSGAASGLWSPFGSAPTVSRLSNWPFSSQPTSDPHGPLPPTPPPPPPPVREEDECAVCHRELPPKGPDGSEAAREAHVIACIQSHFSGGTRGDRAPAPGTAVAAAVAASAATPAQAGGGPTSPQHSTVPASPRRRAPGMLVYHASEKDCMAEDESPQECVICFEEFAVGDEMGRLECLCKFHRVCIRQWWDTKGVGACPVHQDGI